MIEHSDQLLRRLTNLQLEQGLDGSGADAVVGIREARADLISPPRRLGFIERFNRVGPDTAIWIAQRLGEPTTCPFGHPIPGSSYVPNKGSTSLDKATTDQKLVIDNVPEDDQDLLEYLVRHRLVPGQKITVKEAAPTRGVLTLQVDSEEVVFNYDIASMIMAYPESSA